MFKVKTILGIKKSKGRQVSDTDTGPVSLISDGAASAPASTPESKISSCQPTHTENENIGNALEVIPAERTLTHLSVDTASDAQTCRVRSGSLSKLMQAVQSPLRPRAKTLSDTDLSSTGSGTDQQTQASTSNTRRRSWFRKATAASEDHNIEPAGVSNSMPRSLSEGNFLDAAKEGTTITQANPTNSNPLPQDGQSRLPSVSREKSQPLSRSPSSSTRRLSDPLADLLDRSQFRSPVLTRFNDALARGESLDEFCQPFALPFTSLLALPCPPQRIRNQTFRCWTVASLLLLAALGFLSEAAILLLVLTKHKSAGANVNCVLPSTWITLGATSCAVYFLLAFWTQVEWANGKRTTAILFPKRLLLV